MDMLAALRAHTDQAEVFQYQGESTRLSFEANQMKSAEVEETQGVALRAVLEGRLGFTAAAGKVAPAQLLEDLQVSARFGEPLSLAFPTPVAASPVATYDPALAEVPLAQMVAVGREIIEALRAVDADAVVSVDIERGVDHATLTNTQGAHIVQDDSCLSIDVTVERVRGDDVLIAYDSVESTAWDDSYRPMIERLARRVALAQRAAPLRSGTMPVLFAPQGASVLMLPLMLGVDGKNVQRGTSPLEHRLGEQIVDPRLSLWDDPTLPGRPASCTYDDEGVPGRRKALIAAGTCQGFLYDLRTAALMGTQSTGNGTRSLLAMPAPHPTNLVLTGGDRPMAEMLGGIEHGLLVENVLGMGQGNAISGAFSNSLGLAYVIERGEVTGRVKNVSIAGNVYELLREVAAISRESEWVYGTLNLPYLLLPAMKVVCQ